MSGYAVAFSCVRAGSYSASMFHSPMECMSVDTDDYVRVLEQLIVPLKLFDVFEARLGHGCRWENMEEHVKRIEMA